MGKPIDSCVQREYYIPITNGSSQSGEIGRHERSGRCARKGMGVRVPPLALHKKRRFYLPLLFFVFSIVTLKHLSIGTSKYTSISPQTKKDLAHDEQSLSSFLNQLVDTEPSILPSADCRRAVTPQPEETADSSLVDVPLLLLFSLGGNPSETSRTIIRADFAAPVTRRPRVVYLPGALPGILITQR